ncbi:MAG: hypothetical protein ACLPPV_13450 [Candidatus Korobacteraceae bacterium]|jgi:hypothetical protein
MKLRFASLSLLGLCLTLSAVPVMAQTVYSNGPINGNTDAWAINFGSMVSDTFNVTDNNTTITGASFGMWLFPGDTLTSAQLSITSRPFGGTSYFDETVNFAQGSCIGNMYGYDICTENTSFSGPALNIGTYWLTLQNATTAEGEPVYWDENSGPSQAFHCCDAMQPGTNAVGTLPSESFTVLGNSTTTSTPEPNDPALFLSGFVGLAAVLRRKLF